ncbi:MAG: hypothetical protein H7Y04_06245, partial [Verrucomicrobia bacterium]|nr:hypothetical protein [Cytophagales bacterium]
MTQKQIGTPQNNLFFWKNWQKPYQWLYGSLLVLLVACLTAYFYGHWFGSYTVIHWQQETYLEAVQIVLDSFSQGLYNFPVEANNYVITEKFVASNHRTYELTNGIFLGIVVISLLLFVTVVTTLSRLFYAIGMTIFVLILLGFKFEYLQLFGNTGNLALGILLALFLPLSYYFQAFRIKTSFWMRFSAFVLAAVLFVALVAIGGKGTHPVMYLTGYGILAPIFITLLFTVMVSHEIIGNLLFLVTRTRHTPRSLLYFSVFSLVYLANMALLYLHNSGYIRWEIFYFDA